MSGFHFSRDPLRMLSYSSLRVTLGHRRTRYRREGVMPADACNSERDTGDKSLASLRREGG